MSEPLPIVQYWHSAEPPEPVASLTRSFAKLNPDRPHLLFDERTAEDFIGERLGEREAAAFRACGPPAMQADYLRCCAILRLGGIWADAGFECARNLDPLLERSRGGELFRSFASDYVLMNGLFAFAAPGHPFLRLVVDLSTALIEMRWNGKVNEITGPLALTAVYRLHRAGSRKEALRRMREQVPEDRLAHFTRYTHAVCDLTGDRCWDDELCAGLRVSAARCLRKWVGRPDRDLPHRGLASHWDKLGFDVYGADRAERSGG